MRSSLLLLAASAISAVAAHSMGGNGYGLRTRSAKAYLQLLARSLDEEEAADLVARYYDDIEERGELEQRDDLVPRNSRKINYQCRVCFATFPATTRESGLAQHAKRHGKTTSQCFGEV